MYFCVSQGLHSLEKYLNLEDFLYHKSMKIKYALKRTGKSLTALKSPWILLFSVGLSAVDRCGTWLYRFLIFAPLSNFNQYKIVLPIFGAAYAAPNKGKTILYKFSSTNQCLHYLSLAFLKKNFNTSISIFH